MTTSGTFSNFGQLINKSTLTNAGTLTNYWNGTLTNSGTLTNTGALSNEFGGTLTNDGSLSNSGTLTNSGTFTGSGSIINDGGTIDNSGSMSIETLTVHSGQTGTLTGTAATSVTTSNISGTLYYTGSGTLTVTTLNLLGGVLTSNGSGGTSLGTVVVASGSTGTINGTGTIELATADVDGTLAISAAITGTGTLTKTGTGILTLSGANSYTGTTIVAAGTLAIAGSLASSSISLAAGATVDFGSSSDTSYAGAITGTGSLTKSGSGTLTLSGANTFSAATLISAGTLKAGAASTFSATSAVTVDAGATLALDGYSQTIAALAGSGSVTLGSNTGTVLTVNSDAATGTTFSGSISGTGGLTKSGSGSLTLSGTSTYTGGTTVTGGTLAIASDASLGNTAGSLTLAGGVLAATAALTLSRSLIVAGTGGTLDNGGNALTLAGTVSGGSNLTLTGVGTTTLTSDSAAFAGTTTVNAGKLQVAAGATLGGSVVVGTNGTLGGYGTVGSVTNAGTVSPGGSIGTLTIAGNYAQTATGNLLIEVSPTASDLLTVTGSATLAGSLTVSPVAGYLYRTGQSWTFLTAAGGLTGSFSSTNSTSWNLRFTPTYTANGITVTVSRLSYSMAAQSSRAASTAVGLDAAAWSATGEMASLIAGLDFSSTAASNRALNMLSAETYDTYSQTLLEGSRTLTSVQRGILRGDAGAGSTAFAGAGDIGPDSVVTQAGADQAGYGHASGNAAPGGDDLAPGQYAVFLRPLGLRTNQYGDKNRTGYESLTGGLTGGVLYKPSAELTLGFAPAFMSQSLAFRSNGSGSGTISDWSIALLAGYRRGALHLDGVARGGLDHLESARRLDLPGVSRTAKGSWNGLNTSLSVAGGYDFKAGNSTLGPIASLEWQYLGEDGFTETGAGTIGQKIKDRDNQALRTMVGGRVTRRFETKIGTVIPELRAGWAAQWLDQSQGIESSFRGAPGSGYRARVSGHAYHAAVIDAGVTVKVNAALSASVRAGVELFRPDHESQAISAGLNYSF